MSEYINIIWELVELSACVAECIIMVNFLVRMMGYKNNTYKFLKNTGFVSVSLFNCSVTPLLIESETASAIIQILVCAGFSMIFMRGSTAYKIFVSMLSIMMIMIVNSFIIMVAGSVLNSSVAELIEVSGGTRFIILILTKLCYFIFSCMIIGIAQNLIPKMTRKERISMLLILIGVIAVGCGVFEIISMDIISGTFALNLAGIISAVTAIPLIIIYIVEKKEFPEHSMRKFRVLNIEHYMKRKYGQKSGKYYNENLKDIISFAVNECVKKNIMLNCNVTPNIENVSENDVMIIISEMLYEIVNVHKKYEHKPYIDFEVLNKDGKLSIIVSHYLISENGEMKTDEFILFNPYRNLIINKMLHKYNGVVFQNQSADKIVTNMWVDFSEVINKVA